ncbi:MAG: hypothetical protein HY748_14120 [Elusimicrobia bacterium]|nr:hypothetical protein [Elusimicrobiota bacterium]
MSDLPIHPHRARILGALSRSGALVLTAPTGSGKSTQTPKFLLEDRRGFPGRVLVLEPRRLAARSLAARVAALAGVRLGREVGYQVRFDSACAKDTTVVFQTYGVFIRRVLSDPWLEGVGTVLLDEFHERTLECDLALAWLKTLRSGRRPDLKIAVLSATLDAGGLLGYLPGAEHIDVPARAFPVDIRWLAPQGREDLGAHALRAMVALGAQKLDGSALVFMPGLKEIKRTVSALGPFCRERGLVLRELHGSMDLADQQKVLDPEAGRRRVIVSTNVAETSLTIPGVTAVIDSGLHRVATYDANRDVNALYVCRVSRSNASQRAGRAGRTAPGRCVRLWGKAEEASMPESLPPEMARLELSGLRLQAASLAAHTFPDGAGDARPPASTASLPCGLDWLTPPRPEAWARAGEILAGLKSLDEGGRITTKGKALNRYPVAPRLAGVLEDSRCLGSEAFGLAAAMVAVFESQFSRRKDKTTDLLAAGRDLLEGRAEYLPWEASEMLRQLTRIGGGESLAKTGADERDIGAVWAAVFTDRLAARARDGLVYQLSDGRKALLPFEKGRVPPDLILAMEVHETAGSGQARQVSVPLYLPCGAETVQRLLPAECAWKEVSEFDERAKRVVKESRLMFRGLALERKQAIADRQDRKAASGLWAEKFASGELRHPGLDDKVRQLEVRIRLAARFYPSQGFPGMGADDWRRVFEQVCEGKNSLKEIEQTSLEPFVVRFLGPARAAFLDKTFPTRKRLPCGGAGRFIYSESKPAELLARLGDFLGMKGTMALCEGRLAVVFDILAPNFRTVQKTADLTSFWSKVYPQVKRELRRKYPKHPWP